MNPTEPLLRCLQPLAARSGEQSQSSPVRAKWRGREIELLPLPIQPLKEGSRLSAKEGVSAFSQKYGQYVQQQLSYDINSKPLDQRTLNRLEEDATRLLRDVRKLNRGSIDHWLASGLAQKAFESVFPFSWRSVPEHEQRHLMEVIQFQLCQQTSMLSYSEALAITSNLVSQHESIFSSQTPKTTEFLNEQQSSRGCVLPGQLKRWAEQHFDKSRAPGEPLENRSGVNLSEFDVKLIGNAEYYSHRVAELLSESPMERLQYASFGEQKEEIRGLAKKLITTLDTLERRPGHIPPKLSQALQEDLVGQLGRMLDLIQQLELNEQQDPMGQQQWQRFKELEVSSVVKLLEQEMLQLNPEGDVSTLSRSKRDKFNRLSETHQAMSEHLERIKQGVDNNLPPLRPSASRKGQAKEQSDAGEYTRGMIKQLEASGLSKAEKKLNRVRSQVISSQDWQTVTTRLDVMIDGRTQHFTSQITPAAQMKWGEGETDIFVHHYEGKGRPSTATGEQYHAVNLGQSELAINIDGKKKTLYKGLRSGTLSAYTLKGEKPRAEAARNRAQELVTAAVRQFLEEHPDYLANNRPIPLKLLSTSLLSADKLRHFLPGQDDELEMQREQIQALKEVQQSLNAGQPLEFSDAQGRQHSLKVNLQVACTNYGVNSLSLTGLSSVVRPWGAAKAINNEGLALLMGSTRQFETIGGWAGEYLSSDAPEEDKHIVRMLAEQIRDLHVSGDYRKEGEDPYKMVERVQLLACKIGAISHFNCKSGKDRTGEADASIKRFAAEVAVRGYVPDPRKPVSQEDRNLNEAFVFGSGNLEWQQMNINLPGYKTHLNKKRMGSYSYQRSHKTQFRVR